MASTELSGEAVETAMNQFAELNLFEKDNVALYQGVDSAKYVETIETSLFQK